MNAPSSSSYDLDELLIDVQAANDATGFPIRTIADQMGLTYRALRYYESIGLIAPRHTMVSASSPRLIAKSWS